LLAVRNTSNKSVLRIFKQSISVVLDALVSLANKFVFNVRQKHTVRQAVHCIA